MWMNSITFSCLSQSLLLFGGLQNLERAHESVINTHHRSSIVKFTAIVGSTKYRHQLSAREKLIAILNNLMRSADQIQVVSSQKLGHNIFTEGERYSAVVFAPSHDVLVRISPQKITKKTSVRNIYLRRSGDMNNAKVSRNLITMPLPVGLMILLI